MGLKIKQKDKLKGLNLGYPNKLVKTVQYADDCIAFLNNKNELCTVSSLIGEYGNASGIKLNFLKCDGIWLGVDKMRQKDCKLFGIKWPDQNRCLGIYVGYSRDKNFKRNWDEKIDKIKHVLTSWKDVTFHYLARFKLSKPVFYHSLYCLHLYWLYHLR